MSRSGCHPRLPSHIRNDEFLTGLDNLSWNDRRLTICEVAIEAEISCGSCNKKWLSNEVYVSEVYSMTANTEQINNHLSVVSSLLEYADTNENFLKIYFNCW
jgi:hypothetical protein